MGRGLDLNLTLTALRQAMSKNTPEIHHSDQGIQYSAPPYTEVLLAAGVQISMAEVGEPKQNGFAEHVIRTIKEEEVDLSEYQDYPRCIQTNRKIYRRRLQQKANSLGFRLSHAKRIRKSLEPKQQRRGESSLRIAKFVSPKWGALHF